MLAQRPRNKINLLPQEEFSDSTVGRILHWAMGTFRILVIVTEMIVMASFLSRFWLDARANDLSDEIKVKQSLIQAKSDFEQRFKATQKQLDVFAQITSQENQISPVIEKVTAYMPLEINLTSFSLTQNALDLKGSSVSEAAIAQFLANLKSEELNLGEVSLINLGSSSQDQTLITFAINVNFDKEKGAK